MIEAVKRQIRVQWRDWVWTLAAVLVAWLSGIVILNIMMEEEGTSYLALGTLMAGMIGGIVSALAGVISIGIHFNIQVAMGCTRKKFFASYYLMSCVMNLLLVLFLFLLCAAETMLYENIYPGIEREVDMFYWLIRAGIPAALAIPVVGNLCGALVMRFGKAAYWGLWFVWMFGFLGIPRIHEAMEEAPESFFGVLGRQVSQAVLSVPANFWILVYIAGVLLCLAVSWGMFRKQQVTA